MNPERRRHARYTALENAFVALGRKFSRVGKIKDISVGGLAFEYIARNEKDPDASQVDIFLTQNDVHLFNLSCKVVYDVVVHVPKVDSQYVDLLTTKRCGVNFGALSASNRRKIRQFIESQNESLKWQNR